MAAGTPAPQVGLEDRPGGVAGAAEGLGASANLPAGGAVRRPVRRLRDGAWSEAADWVAEEVPVALEYNGISHAVMLATPLDLEDFALGFSLAEGILDRPGELYGVEVVPSTLGITLQLEVASASFARLKDRRRTLAGRTGCGLCGTESLHDVRRPFAPPGAAAVDVAPAAIARAFERFAAHQALQSLTGAVHAAAWCTPDGEVGLLREDVGRHNALDKLTGALAKTELEASAGFIAVTSRASFEMVQKTAAAGVRLLAAVSAPTALAIETARSAGITLLGFVRGQGCVVYHGGLAGSTGRDGAPELNRDGAPA